MTFWKHNQSSSPQIEAILAKEDLTLNELFDQDCLFQELKSSNKALIDFITRNDILSELVRLVTEEPSVDVDEKEKYKLANLACEVLTTDTPTINEKLSDKMHLSKLYSFLESEPPLNPLLASFFSRTLSMLICRKHDQHWYSYQFTCLQVLDFLKSQPKSLDLLVKHLGTSAIMELTLKLLTQVEGVDLQNTLNNLLENECLIDNLIALFDPSVDEDRHYNVAALLCDTIYKAKDDMNNSADNGEKRKTDTNLIFDKIQSASMVDRLLSYCFGENVSESSIVSGIAVLHALLCPPSCTNLNRRGCDEVVSGSGDSLHSAITNEMNLPVILSTILPYLPRLHQLLIDPPKREAIKLACGIVDPPLGQARLNIVKLLATLITTNNPEINAKLDQLNTVQILLDLFFQYTWNNFLHAQVERCLALALNSSTYESAQSNPLLPNIFVKCRIFQRILNAWEENDMEQSKGNRRRGYMGHLISIANNLEKQFEDESMGGFINQNVDADTIESWKTFVRQTLTPINNIHNKCLGGQHPAQASEDEELNMKSTFDMQDESILKLQSSDQPDYSNLIENIIPNFQDHLSFQEEDIFMKQFSNIMKDSTWQNMPSLADPPCGDSSDEELEDDPDTAGGGNLLESTNPWSGVVDPGLDSNDSELWANFDSNFSSPPFHSEPAAPHPPPLPLHPHIPATSLSDMESGVSDLIGDDEDCNPPTEFEFEDSVETDEERFEPAVDSSRTPESTEALDPTKTLNRVKVTVINESEAPPIEAVTTTAVPTEQSHDSNSTAGNDVDPQPPTRPNAEMTTVAGELSSSDVTEPSRNESDLRPVKTSEECCDSGGTPEELSWNADKPRDTVASRVPEKGVMVESPLAQQILLDAQKEKENKVPENSDNPVAEKVKCEDKQVEGSV